MKKLFFVLLVLFVVTPTFAFASFDTNLRYGSSGSTVMELQEFLVDQGLLTTTPTGNFFSLTLRAVKAFQTRENIYPVSGFFGPLTRARVNTLLALQLKDSDTEASNTPTITQPPAPVQIVPTPIQIPTPNSTLPTPTPSATIPNGPIPSEISIQSQVCNLTNTNLKTEYVLSDLLQNGNSDGRIFMNAFVLDQSKRNYYTNNPSPQMLITTSDHSNDKVFNGSGDAGPCGYHYAYAFYATKAGTYTVMYSVPTLNLSKTVTIIVKGPEKPVIISSGITVSTPQKETDYPLSDRASFASSTVKYWMQSSKPDSYITAQCSDSDTPFTKVEVVSSFGADGLYYPRGRFSSDGLFSGNTVCKFIHGNDNSMTITTESDPVTFNVQ